MSVKFKFSEKNDSWTLKGLQWEHVEVLATLLSHTKLGGDTYEQATFEMLEALESDQGDVSYITDNVAVNFYREKEDGTQKNYGDDMGISLTEVDASW